MSDFSQLQIKEQLLESIKILGYQQMTPIQSMSVPLILQGKDVIAQAKTGSGKTVAFGLGVLQNLKVEKFRIQSLILCPTRELADQVAKSLRKLAQCTHNVKILTLCGGVPTAPQIASLEHGAHIIVGTPGRIADLLDKRCLNLSFIDTLVFDEADRMLEMGFADDIDYIVDQLPEERQTMLFSATFPDKIKEIAEQYLYEPQSVKVEAYHSRKNIEQFFYKMKSTDNKNLAIKKLLLQQKPASTLIFCSTKAETDEVANYLKMQKIRALAIHGDMEQRDRESVLVQFSNKSVSALVATDVAARGLDIESLDLVINHQLSKDPEVHVHRIGRTGRAGNSGVAVSLVADNEKYRIKRIEEYMDDRFEIQDFPQIDIDPATELSPLFVTLQINAGKKQKLRPGDILGGLTGKNGVEGSMIGKINIYDFCSFVAVDPSVAKTAVQKLMNDGIKGKNFKARMM